MDDSIVPPPPPHIELLSSNHEEGCCITHVISYLDYDSRKYASASCVYLHNAVSDFEKQCFSRQTTPKVGTGASTRHGRELLHPQEDDIVEKTS